MELRLKLLLLSDLSLDVYITVYVGDDSIRND